VISDCRAKLVKRTVDVEKSDNFMFKAPLKSLNEHVFSFLCWCISYWNRKWVPLFT